MLDLMKMPRVCRFENYAAEVGQFLEDHDIKYDRAQLSTKTNTTKHEHYSWYYTIPDHIEFIRQSCGIDIQLFGYSYEKPKGTNQ